MAEGDKEEVILHSEAAKADAINRALGERRPRSFRDPSAATIDMLAAGKVAGNPRKAHTAQQ